MPPQQIIQRILAFPWRISAEATQVRWLTLAIDGTESKQGANPADFYCPKCNGPVADPLTCGDCGSLICRRCGSALEDIAELGLG